MHYKVPLLLINAYEPMGFYCIHTSEGKVVIVFSDSNRWEAFADPVARALAKQGQKLAAAEFDLPSFEALVSKIVETDPNVTNDVTFVPDSTPILPEVIRFFASQA